MSNIPVLNLVEVVLPSMALDNTEFCVVQQFVLLMPPFTIAYGLLLMVLLVIL